MTLQLPSSEPQPSAVCAAQEFEAPVVSPPFEPISFGGMLGALHRPPSPARDVGVVICAPVGRDARCAHLLLRRIAEGLAERGYPALRFDYLGCGDSLDLEAEADALSAWTQNVHQAADALRSATGVHRLVFCGLRLGASLAAIAAAEREDVAGLVLLAPVRRGRTWLRELKLAAELSTPSHRPGPSNEGSHEPPAALASDGLELSGATIEALSALDLDRLVRTPAEVLLVSPSEAVAGLGSHLADFGARITRQPFEDYATLFEESHANTVPEALVRLVPTWVAERLPARIDPVSREERPFHPAELRLPGAVERPVMFGAGLRGVLCRPVSSGDGRVVVFCNTGGDPRVGAGRFSTQAARRLAQEGVASLRFDFAGLGDSPASGGALRSHIYETPRRSDLDAALSLLAAEGLDQPVLAGVCSGAHHAFWAAVADPRVRGLFLVNLVKFAWRAGDSISIGRSDQARAARSYLRDLGKPEVWKRLARAEVRAGAIIASLLRRFVSRRDWADGRERRAVRQAAATLSRRGVEAHLLLGVDDGALDELQGRFGRNGRRWAAKPHLTLHILDGLDHGLLRAASRAAAIEELCALLRR